MKHMVKVLQILVVKFPEVDINQPCPLFILNKYECTKDQELVDAEKTLFGEE